MQVLEAATKALSSMTCYQQDVRLLRLWVQYVSGPHRCGSAC